ncbi:MAG TPA: hypothetical protein PKA64_18315 [Myxococcota bacterium]|nr:hypothetical protein [Myxococcota bacterium]
MRARVWLLLGLVGCNPYRKMLLHSEIVEVCPGGSPERSLIHFEKGGRFDWRYPEHKRWREGDDETWALRKDRLTLSWNDGYAVSIYRLDEQKGERFPGSTTKASCVNTIRLERTGERADR